MPFVPTPGVAEVKFSHTINGAPDKGWVLHYTRDGGEAWTVDTLEDLNQALVAWWNLRQKPLMHSSTRLDRIRSRDISTLNSFQAETTAGLPISGTRAGVSVPNQIVLSVKKITGFTGKSFRGRIYQFGFVQADLGTPVLVTNAFLNSVEQAWADSLLIVGALDNYNHVLVSKYSNGNPRIEGQIALIQSMGVVDQRVDTNRKKLPKGSA